MVVVKTTNGTYHEMVERNTHVFKTNTAIQFTPGFVWVVLFNVLFF